AIVEPLPEVHRLPAPHVVGALGPIDGRGDPQADPPVDAALAPGVLVVRLDDGHLVSQELRLSGAGVGDQGLGVGELQLEIIAQELAELTWVASVSARGPLNPSRKSSAYRTYLSRRYSGSFVSTEGSFCSSLRSCRASS